MRLRCASSPDDAESKERSAFLGDTRALFMRHSTSGRVGASPVQVSSADRVVYPEVGWTKGDVVAYYSAVASTMLPHLAGRPLTLQRYPKGLSGPGFMQKNAPSHYPDEIGVWEVPKVDGGSTRYPVVTTEGAIPYLANQGTITFHAWTSTVDHAHHPDWLVMDLDPAEGDVESAREVAMATKQVFDTYGLESLPVATGSKGFHVWVSLEPTLDYAVVGRAARALAAFVELAVPDRGGRCVPHPVDKHPPATVLFQELARGPRGGSVLAQAPFERFGGDADHVGRTPDDQPRWLDGGRRSGAGPSCTAVP